MPPHIVNQDRVKSFPTEAAFEEWLSANHASEKEVWIQIYKKGSGVPTITPVQAIDVALCWGWIDGVRKALDDTSFLQRYTPRKAKSIWSQINRDNVARLTAAGRMTPHGQRQIDAALADGRLDAAYAPMRNTTEATLPADLRAAIDADPRALETFKRLGRQNLFALAFRTNSMKTAAGRAKKIAELVALLATGGTIVPERSAPERSAPEQPPPHEGTPPLPKAPAPAKAHPPEGKVVPKAPVPVKAKPAKAKAAVPKASAKAKAKPAKRKAGAPKAAKATRAAKTAAASKPARKAKATRAAKTAAASKPARKAKAKKATAPAKKKKAKAKKK